MKKYTTLILGFVSVIFFIGGILQALKSEWIMCGMKLFLSLIMILLIIKNKDKSSDANGDKETASNK
jgi:predicted membrane protein